MPSASDLALGHLVGGLAVSYHTSMTPPGPFHAGTAHFDFTGTGPQVLGNCNAPKAVTYSAIIYCMRCMVARDIPLNQGCLNPCTVVIPEGTILAPGAEAAVVGGERCWWVVKLLRGVGG